MARAEGGAALCGFVLIDKPAGWTSHDVVARARRVLGVRRIGHAGTLDPMATGVLVLGVGRATRLLGLISDADKTYEATIRLGLATTTDDIEGDPLATQSAAHITQAELTSAMAPLTGDILQRPSSVSAVKVAGKRAHALVRAGEQVELPERPVRVTRFDLLALRPGPDGTLEADVEVRCGSGTYVRALARDLGQALGVGGCLSALRRTEAAGVPVTECRAVEDFAAAPQLVPVGQVIGHTLELLEVPAEAVVELSHGRQAAQPYTPAPDGPDSHGAHSHGPDSHAGSAHRVAVVGPGGDVAAIARAEGGMLVPDVVLVDPVMGATQ